MAAACSPPSSAACSPAAESLGLTTAEDAERWHDEFARDMREHGDHAALWPLLIGAWKRKAALMPRDHAVVVGGSMAGLLAARVLSDHYDRVTVLDRDALPAGLEGRRGVPQGRHAHCGCPRRGAPRAALPGLGAELVAAGASTCAALEQLRWIVNGHQLARADTGLDVILAGRPFIEGHVRRRVRALPNVELVDGCEALGLVGGGRDRRVTGVLGPRRRVERRSKPISWCARAAGRPRCPAGWRRSATRSRRRSAWPST